MLFASKNPGSNDSIVKKCAGGQVYGVETVHPHTVNTMTNPDNSRTARPTRQLRQAREGTLPPAPVRWGVPDAVVALALGAALVYGNFLLETQPWFPRGDVAAVTASIVFYGILFAFIIGVSRLRGLGGLRRDFGFELRWIDLPIGIGIAIAFQVLSVVVDLFGLDVLHLPNVDTSNVELPKSLGLAVFYGLAIVSFFAPIVEELIFRGLVMRSVRNVVIRRARFESAKTTRRAQGASILISALLFAGGHLYEARNLTMLFDLGVSIFIFGLIMAAVDSRTGRLGPSLIAHMLTNGFATVVILSAAQR